jgi:hypothetical protein
VGPVADLTVSHGDPILQVPVDQSRISLSNHTKNQSELKSHRNA